VSEARRRATRPQAGGAHDGEAHGGRPQSGGAAANPSRLRRERERAQMRDRLLAAAREIATVEGWQAVTIRRLADRLEYASPILYQHFAGKEALLVALAGDGFAQVTEALRVAVAEPPDRLLTAVAMAYWDFAFAAPELYRVMHGLDGVPFGTAETPAPARDAFELCREALHRLAAARGRTLADADGAVDTIWAYLHGFVSLAMSRRIAGPPERARDLMLRGLPAVFASTLH
jgi:AcrR family transcriptional regulator